MNNEFKRIAKMMIWALSNLRIIIDDPNHKREPLQTSVCSGAISLRRSTAISDTVRDVLVRGACGAINW